MDITNHTTGEKCHLKYHAYSYFSRDSPKKVCLYPYLDIILKRNFMVLEHFPIIIKYCEIGNTLFNFWTPYFAEATVFTVRSYSILLVLFFLI